MRKEENSKQMLMEGVENPDFSHAEKVEEVSSEPVYETETGEQIKFDTDVDLGLDKAYVDEKIKEVMDRDLLKIQNIFRHFAPLLSCINTLLAQS